jgi:hypothetical protein
MKQDGRRKKIEEYKKHNYKIILIRIQMGV